VFAVLDFEGYERASIDTLTKALQGDDEMVFFDVGCSLGVYSLVALTVSSSVQVFAFDPDPYSVAATKLLSKHVDRPNGNGRIHGVSAFVADVDRECISISEAVIRTSRLLSELRTSGDPLATRYLYLAADRQSEVPVFRLDTLFPANAAELHGRKLVIKCDVEGAEYAVLRGAERLLRDYKPDILLSVGLCARYQAAPKESHLVAVKRIF
jgi:FkbM family methyltransferase